MELLRSTIFIGDQHPPLSSGLQISDSDDARDVEARLKVLVVDDERLLADTTADILRRAGFETRTAYDAMSALETTAAFLPDFLVTDVMMPNMNGVELAIAISMMFPATKILLFSGQAGVSDILEEGRTKGYEFPLLAKPIHPIKLIEGIKNLKDR